MKVKVAPRGFNYDFRSICFFEIDADGDINVLAGDKDSIRRKAPNSVYDAYLRALRGDCKLYIAFPENSSRTTVYYVEHLEDVAASLALPRTDGHTHIVHAELSKSDPGSGVYALVDVEFCCGCTVSSQNIRSIADDLKEQYGWEVVISHMNFIPESKKQLKIKRNSLSKTVLPF